MRSWRMVFVLIVALLVGLNDHVESKKVEKVKNTFQAEDETSIQRALNEEIASSVTTEQNIPTHTTLPASKISVKVITDVPHTKYSTLKTPIKSTKKVQKIKTLRRSKNKNTTIKKSTEPISKTTTESMSTSFEYEINTGKNSLIDSKVKQSQPTTESLIKHMNAGNISRITGKTKTAMKYNNNTGNVVSTNTEKVTTITELINTAVEGDNTTTEDVNTTKENNNTTYEDINSNMDDVNTTVRDVKVVKKYDHTTTEKVNNAPEKNIVTKEKVTTIKSEAKQFNQLVKIVPDKTKPSEIQSRRSRISEEGIEQANDATEEKAVKPKLTELKESQKGMKSEEYNGEEVSELTYDTRRIKKCSKSKGKKKTDAHGKRRKTYYHRRRPNIGDDNSLEIDSLIGDNLARIDDYAQDLPPQDSVSSENHRQQMTHLHHDLSKPPTRRNLLDQSNVPSIEYLLKQASMERQLHLVRPNILRTLTNPVYFETYIYRNPQLPGRQRFRFRNNENINKQITAPISYPQLNLNTFPGYLNQQPPLVPMTSNTFYTNLRTLIFPNRPVKNMLVRQSFVAPYGINNVNI